MKKNAIFTDLDGTFLTSKKTVSETNKEMIGEFKKRGGMFSMATGRNLKGIKSILEEVDVDFPVVLCNGAVVYDSKNKECVSIKLITREVISEVFDMYLRYKEELGLTLIGSTVNEIYIHNDLEELKKWLNKDVTSRWVRKPLDEIKVKDLIKITFIAKRENILMFSEKISRYNHFISAQDCIDVVPEGVSKWTGIQKSLEYAGAEIDQIFTFGDSPNDIEMLQGAHTGIAMKNGCDTIFDRADHITEFTNDEDGVGIFVGGIINNRN